MSSNSRANVVLKNIKDVADKAGVSVKTVSRALSDKNKVAQKTRDRIYQIMEEMEYYPSLLSIVLY